MKVVALVLSTFILALLCHEVRCQECGTNTTWSMSTYSVSEGAGIVSLTARQGSSGQALQFSSRADTAIGSYKISRTDVVRYNHYCLYTCSWSTWR